MEDLRAWLGTTVSVRTAERMNRDMAQYSEGYRLSQGLPAPDEDEPILVVSADGKGVPMRRPLESGWLRKAFEHRGRRSSGQDPGDSSHPGKKQMAYVGAVYSIAPYVRTAEEVIDEVCRRKRSSERPRPVQKHLWAEMTHLREGEVWPAAPWLFIDMAVECHQRDPSARRPWSA